MVLAAPGVQKLSFAGNAEFLKRTQIPQISQIWEDLKTDVLDALIALSPCERAPRPRLSYHLPSLQGDANLLGE